MNNQNARNDGNNNLANTGNNNSFVTLNIDSSSKTLNKTFLYDFCKMFSEVEDSLEEDNHFMAPSGIIQKIEYNEIENYKVIFEECDFYLKDVEEILNQIPKRKRIIFNIHKTYLRAKKETGFSKDDMCDFVHDELYTQLINCREAKDISVQDAQLAICALMYYAFTKCKLLDPVPVA